MAIFQPAYSLSPDFNPIEKMWYIIKNLVQNNAQENIIYNRWSVAVKIAGKNLGGHYLLP